ncbi:MAG TPA: cation:proton antiporter [Anaeromyxobacteraceae bacterium]|nr:cation:proton antiporter [Anaeromyxobacteraceae bacterium]
MHGAHDFLVALAVVLGVAAVTTVLFQRLRQPVVLGYLLAGLIVGPSVPVPLLADRQIVQTLSDLGVILLMFALGLEFRVRKLAEVGPTAGLTALVETSLMVWLGFVTGRAFGWTLLESVFAGAVIAISSTTIIAKAFDELGIRGRLRDFVVGVLVAEDLIAIVLMTVLTALARGAGLSAGALALTAGRLGLFLAALLAVGMLVVPRAIRWVRHLDRPETTLVATLGLCFGVALLAEELGYSVALGAFIAGSLVAESGEAAAVERLVHPVRDMFAAVFFVSVGMLIDPAVVLAHWGAVLALTLVVLLGKLLGVSFGAFLTGQGTRTSVQAAMSLAQIGEFSFIIAGLGLSLGATRGFLLPVAVSVSAVTALTTPWLIRAAGPAAALVDRKLPRPLQTVAALYGSWIEQVRTSPRRQTSAARARRIVRALLVDAAAITGIVIGLSLAMARGAHALEAHLGIGARAAGWLVAAAGGLLSIPFVVGLVRNARRMGETLSAAALPEQAEARPDLAAAPRRALVLTVQLATVLLTGVPILAVTAPFLPAASGPAVLASVLVVLGVGFWRGASNLHGHVRAGAQVIVEALAHQAASHEHEAADATRDALAQVKQILPGIGDPVAVKLEGGSAAVGLTLAAIGLRGQTGASVLAIWRPEGGVMIPSAGEALREGDVLALAGSREAIAAAVELLGAREAALPRSA